MAQTYTPKWWQTGIIYQIYPRSFMDSNGDGIGDLPGIIQKLDYLAWLGADAIWFSPTFPSPMADFGYDVSDYTDVHPDFGTLEDFDHLVAEAKKRDIRIILDLVPNHTSDQHTWFKESRSSKDNPKRDWYIWKDAKPDGSEPNNWLAFFGGSVWEYDEATEQYYLHSFLKEQPDLNWRNPEVKAAVFDAIRFWLDRGVAGFRVDVIDFMLKDEQFRDEPPNPNYDSDKHIPREQLIHLYCAYQPEVHDLIREMRAVFDEYDDAVFIGEIDYFAPMEKALTYYGKNNDGLMLPFNFYFPSSHFLAQERTTQEIRDYINKYDAALNKDQQPNWVYGNHDMPRVASKVGEQSRVYALMQLTLRGTPFIYYGEEIGMENVDIPYEQQQDPFGLRVPGQGRDLCRTPMQWDYSENAGFTAPDATPWLPLADNHKTVNVAVQQKDEQSMLALYQQLIQLRRNISALNNGIYYPIPDLPDDMIAYVRQYNDQRFAVILNFEDQERTININGLKNANIILSTGLDRNENTDLSALTLRPYEGLLVEIPAGTQAVQRIVIDEND